MSGPGGYAGGAQPRSVRITGWGSYVPERVLSNADLERLVDTSDEWIQTRTGIRERRVAAPHETTATLGADRREARRRRRRPRARRHRRDHRRDPDARLPDARDRGPREGGDRQPDRGRVRPGRRLLRVRVRRTRPRTPTSAPGWRATSCVVGAELLTRFLDFSDRSTCILFGDGAGAVVLSASDEEGGGLAGARADDRPGRRLHDLAAVGRLEEPADEGDDAARRALHPDGGPRDLPLRDPHARRVRARGDREGRLGAGRRRPLHPPPGEHPYHRGGREGPRAPDGEDVRQRRSLRQHVGRLGRHRARRGRPQRAGRSRATDSCSSRSGPASRAAPPRSPGPPTRRDSERSTGRRRRGERARARLDWAGVDPMPPRLAAVLADPSGPPVPLDDVVPGEPEHARKEEPR